MRIDRTRQVGLASVEAILTLPFLFLLVLLVVHSARILTLKQASVVESRTMAWRHALLGSECRVVPVARYGGRLLSNTCDDSSPPGGNPTAYASQFYQTLQRGPQSGDQRKLVGELQVVGGTPAMVTAHATTLYHATGGYELGFVKIEDFHSVDAQPAWKLDALPIGYDQLLKRELNSRILYPNFFPRAR